MDFSVLLENNTGFTSQRKCTPRTEVDVTFICITLITEIQCDTSRIGSGLFSVAKCTTSCITPVCFSETVTWANWHHIMVIFLPELKLLWENHDLICLLKKSAWHRFTCTWIKANSIGITTLFFITMASLLSVHIIAIDLITSHIHNSHFLILVWNLVN